MQLVTALLAQSMSAVIQTWTFNNAVCATGSCEHTDNLTENTCHPNPDDTDTFVVASCILNPNWHSLSAAYLSFGSDTFLHQCPMETARAHHVPCDVCVQGPNGAPMMTVGCDNVSAWMTKPPNVTYNCNEDCSNCTGIAPLNGTCQDAGGMLIQSAIMQSKVWWCENLVTMDIYSDYKCNSLLRSGYMVSEGLSKCGSRDSGSRSNFLTCL